ncbi:OmpA family protein [uncultured Arcticibacterium sp.]|uniref:OmpA family protein n=1 Tax=uncultured Arcticibacterium sp. TaxID=2173042 RepID=UPI0030F792BE
MTKAKILFSCVLAFFSSLVFGQAENSRFGISPHFGLGMLLPGAQKAIEGNQRMNYLWKFYNIGYTTNNQGERSFNLQTTNRIGVNFNYKLSNNIDLTAGGTRINYVSAYKPSLNYDFQGQQVQAFLDDFNYLSLNFGVKYRAYNLYYVVQGNFIPNVNGFYQRRKEKYSSDIISGDYTNTSGTGLKFNTLVSNDLKYGLYLGIGQEVFLGGDTELELGFSFALQPLYVEQIDFYNRGSLIGRNRNNKLINGVFLGLKQSFNFRKKEKRPKPKKKKTPRVEVNEESFEIGESAVRVGEDLVMDEIQFEQSSSELDYFSQQSLNSIYAFLLRYPKSKIEISGHTSSEGDRGANIELSEKRAEACKDYLISKGISGRRIRTLGLGPDRPISRKEEELNRRVEVKILSME